MKINLRSLCCADRPVEYDRPQLPRSKLVASQASSTPTFVPVPLQGLQSRTRAPTIDGIAPASRILPAGSMRGVHSEFGELTITYSEKSAEASSITFRLHLQAPDGKSLKTTQSMYVDDHDEDFNGQSTLGYSDIFLPTGMQGKGIGYFLHSFAAGAAHQIRVKRFVVSNVVSPAMHALCANIGMDDDGCANFYYSGNPRTVAKLAQAKAISKGWTVA